MDKTRIILIIVCLAFIAAYVTVVKITLKREAKESRCCGYCTYWFQCSARPGGRWEKKSTPRETVYTDWEDSCDDYDGFADEEE